MKKKSVVLCSAILTTTFSLAAVLIFSGKTNVLSKGQDENSHIVLDSSTQVEIQEVDQLVEVNIRNNKIDLYGYHEASDAFAKIQREACDNFTYNGMVFNKSAINGFKSLTVDFSGGTLYYVFTDFLMEDMNFNHNTTLTSGTAVDVPNNEAYFLVYNLSETPVTINSMDIEYSCDGSIDNEMVFNKNSQTGGARSVSSRSDFEDSFVELQNNPLDNNNNYSTGSHNGHPDAWYRWNGKYFANSANLGTDFTFGLTIMGDFGMVCDTSMNFHYAVWPEFTYVGSPTNEKGSPTDTCYVQTYIGNDNYEPLGAANALHPSDPYTAYSYTGRFFTDYGWYNNNWEFANPDVEKIDDGSLTFRQAYEAYDMPFWFVKFHVYLGADNAYCDTYINGFKLFTDELFESYDVNAHPDIYIKTMPMHIVNYGIDANGTPDDWYVGRFTYPRLIIS